MYDGSRLRWKTGLLLSSACLSALGLTRAGGQDASDVSPLYKPGGLYATDPIVGNLRYVPPTGPKGFQQGSPASEPCREAQEEDQFTHIVTRKIAFMETEITRQMWADLRAVQPSLPVDPSYVGWGTEMNRPVNKITWYEAALFANLLSIQRGLTPCYYTDSKKGTLITSVNYKKNKYFCDFSASGYRLPSEGEWEYACRAGTKGPFWINEPQYTSNACYDYCYKYKFPTLQTAAWFECNGNGQTHPVGQKKPNPWKLKDMHGNVREWCWDNNLFYYPTGTQTNYTGPEGPRDRAIIRGGGSAVATHACRSASRYSNKPTYRYSSIGFRLVRTIP
ncbi:MAG: formylglycine-generating enzyme family protein [Acidobacteriota bacterium]